MCQSPRTLLALPRPLHSLRPPHGTHLVGGISGPSVTPCHPSVAVTVGMLLWGMSLLLLPRIAIAHAGHDHGAEFQAGSAQPVRGIRVDAPTAMRLGITVQPVRQQVLETGIETTATITAQPDQQATVKAPIDGTVRELLVKPGDRVQAGQALAVILAPELIELRVTAQTHRVQAEAALRTAQTHLTLAQRNYERQQAIAAAEIAAAQQQVTFAQDRYDRDRELLQAGAIANQQALASEAALAAAQSQLTRAQSREAVLQAEAERDRAQAALDAAQSQVPLSTAAYETRLQQLQSPATAQGLVTVLAPITGVIADRPITPGETVEVAVTPLLQIVNPDRLLVTAEVYEKDLAAIALGQRVRATVASLPGQIVTGQVVVVGAVVAADTRRVPVTVALDNQHHQLKPGMFATLELLTERTPTPVLTVPPTALVEAEGRSLVFVENGQVFEPVEVSVGRRAGDQVEITRGLFAGDRVVTQGGLQLYAQSLRGDGGQEDAAVVPPDSPTPESTPAGTTRLSLPWWAWLPASGVLVGAAFWTGRRYAFGVAQLSRPQSAAIPGTSPLLGEGMTATEAQPQARVAAELEAAEVE